MKAAKLSFESAFCFNKLLPENIKWQKRDYQDTGPSKSEQIRPKRPFFTTGLSYFCSISTDSTHSLRVRVSWFPAVPRGPRFSGTKPYQHHRAEPSGRTFPASGLLKKRIETINKYFDNCDRYVLPPFG